MNFLNPLFAVILTVLAILLVRTTFIFVQDKSSPTHFETIDGLRGYLAFFVFLHHAAVWYSFCRTGLWVTLDSHLYTHLGQSSVGLFFMISSFLFYNKLLNRKFQKINWRSFFIGRFFRLTPLYLSVIISMFLLVAVLSDGALIDKPKYILYCLVRWVLFTIPGAPKINSIEADQIVAYVTWSLIYEWYFYFALPLISLSTGQRPSWALLVSLVGICLAWYGGFQLKFAASFFGGMVAAQLIRLPSFKLFAQTSSASALVLVCMASVLFFPGAYGIFPSMILSVAFCLIAGGANIFGLLIWKTSRRLGELAYSIYLAHGILLFSMINFIVGKKNIAMMSSIYYWICIAITVPFLLVISTITFRYIETPGISLGKKLEARWSRVHGMQSAQAEGPQNP